MLISLVAGRQYDHALAKGNRSQQVTDACKETWRLLPGSIGGPAAVLAQGSISARSAWNILNWV